ncbi:hypothetical protein [Ferrimonas pelagia]|uniref:Uncharacterized protein n=1 Tax=Ferrimonas pelagia TaxID=1177826 RepID=A0ABP9EHF0_9GAMM
MHYLIASLLILAVGPVLYHGFRRQPKVRNGITAFIIVALLGLVLFDVLPSLWQQGGAMILPFVLLGLAGPTLAEKAFRPFQGATHNLTLLLGLSGLLLHTLTDGSAVALATHAPDSSMLAIGVVLHRLPAGLAVWWLLRPAFGRLAASIMLAAMMLCTLLGFAFGEHLPHYLADNQMIWLQAFVTGSIVHVLLHRPHEHSHEHHHSHRHTLRLTPGHYLGGAFGLLFLTLLMLSHGHDHAIHTAPDNDHAHQH